MAQVRITADALRASLSLPKSALPMRANAATREALAQVRVSRDGYVRQLEARKGRPTFVLHDGPPYANGNAHMGHLLNKTIKDVINRHAMLRGKRVVYIPGWDCHGLPIEHKALQSVEDPDTARLRPWIVRPQARSVALGALADQARDCERWGVAADWEAVGAAARDPAAGGAEGSAAGAPTRGVWPGAYRTLDPAYEGAQLRLLRSLIARDLVFRGLRPVHWSPSSLTAVAEAELEYADDHVSTAVWVRFDLASLDHADVASLPAQLIDALAAAADGGAGVSLAAWTTTPWTLPANEALCVHPRLRYVAAAVEADDGPLPRGHLLVVAESRVAAVEEALWPPAADGAAPASSDAQGTAAPPRLRVVGEAFDGAALVGARCKHPLADADPATYGPAVRLPPVLAGGHVTDESGSGVVHTAPGHGAEDWQCVLESAAPARGEADGTTTTDDAAAAAAAAAAAEEGPVGAAWLPADASRAAAVSAMAAGLLGTGPSGAVDRVRCPVDAAGLFTAEAGWDLEGVDATTAGSKRILEGLGSASRLLAAAEHRHRYPIDWRTKQPVMTRATWQWFASAEALHEAACAALDDVTMVPPAGRARLEAAVRGRKAWCISRQRSWGVPIPVHYSGGDSSAGERSPELGDDVLAAAEALVTRCGAGAWWTAPVDGALPAEREDLRARAREGGLERGRDTLDVWFDSGASWLAAWAGREGAEAEVGRGDDSARALPVSDPGAAAGGPALRGVRADVVVEGSDQHRGWFQSSLLTAVAAAPGGAAPRAPFGAVVTHGFVLDADGRKMSKSLGNVVAPSELIDHRTAPQAGGGQTKGQGRGKHKQGHAKATTKSKGGRKGRPAALDGGLGADVVRQWAAGTDYTTDVVLAEQPLASAADGVRRIRNVSRFLLGAVTPRAVRLWGGDGSFSELDSALQQGRHALDVETPLVEAWAAPAPSADALLRLDQDSAQAAPAGPLERLVLHRLRRAAEAADDAIGARFATARAVAELQSFLSNDVSALLVDASKDALYAGLPGQWRRASAQAAAWHVMRGVALLTSPVTPFLAEEVFQASALPLLCRHGAPDLEGRDLAARPLAPGATLVDAITAMGPSGWEAAVPSCWRDDSLEAPTRFGGVEVLRSLASHAREEARRAGAVRSDLETAATVIVEQGSPLAEAAQWMAGQGGFASEAQLAASGGFDPAAYPGLEPLCDVLRVSGATVMEVPAGAVAATARELGGFVASSSADDARTCGESAVVVSAASGRKCARCWRVDASVPAATAADLDTDHCVCSRCADALRR